MGAATRRSSAGCVCQGGHQMACSIPRVYFHHSCSPGDSVFSGVSKQRCQRKLPPAGGPKLRVRLGEKGSHQVSVTLRIQLRPGSVPSRCPTPPHLAPMKFVFATHHDSPSWAWHLSSPSSQIMPFWLVKTVAFSLS